ncbi:MAG: hypothetical protein ACLFPV_14280 [Spirochaetaceae bacterium]
MHTIIEAVRLLSPPHLWMVKRAELVVLFPDDLLTGRWRRGSALAFLAGTPPKL